MILSAEWLRHQLRELIVDHGRVLLVILGVVWGTLSLTVVLSFGQGFHAAMTNTVHASGRNLLRLYSGMTTRPYAGLPAGRWTRLVPEDALLLEQNVPGIQAVSVEYCSTGDPMEYRGRQINARTHGVSSSYSDLRSMHAEPGGRFLNERDLTEQRRVVFLGSAVKERLFGEAPAVGATLKLWGIPFTVVGVMQPKICLMNYEGMDPDKVFIPATTFRILRGWRYVSYLIVGLESPDQDQAAARQMRRILGVRHGFDPQDEAALGFWNHIAEDRRVLNIINGIRILMGIIGLLGLLVSLIGVANVMYVLVDERRREIGIQMALGIKPVSLMGGFFFESLVMTGSGGVLGLLASSMVLWLFNHLPLGDTARAFLGQPKVSFLIAMIITACLAFAGSAAGYFPARRASRLDPVTALHEE